MAAKFTRLTHKIATQPNLVADSFTICISCSRRSVRKLLDTPSVYSIWSTLFHSLFVHTLACIIEVYDQQYGGFALDIQVFMSKCTKFCRD